jgi:hypothetical protein
VCGNSEEMRTGGINTAKDEMSANVTLISDHQLERMKQSRQLT